jgi:hypothetical protein
MLLFLSLFLRLSERAGAGLLLKLGQWVFLNPSHVLCGIQIKFVI